MKIGFVTSNANFSGPLIAEFDRRGHDVLVYQHTDSELQNAFQMGQLRPQADRLFVDWAQPPLEWCLQQFECPIYVRAHRIEMYSDDYLRGLDWSKVHTLFFIAGHVEERFTSKLASAPGQILNLGHVGIDTGYWTMEPAERNWEPPYRIVLAGNIVPKKRVYTAVQLAYDLGEDWHLEVYGSGGQGGYGNPEYPQNVSDLVEELGLIGRIHADKHLPREELRAKYRAAHAVLSASNEEGCHTAVAEGMACGCLPLVNAWRGARDVYPAEWVWRSPLELYALCARWAALSRQSKTELAYTMREAVLRYDAATIAGRVADIVTGPVGATEVGEWYSEHMLAHMIEQDGNARQQDALAACRQWLPKPPASVLEVGCGLGYIARTLAADGYQAYGQDVAQAQLEWAGEHNPGGATFACADATQHLITGPHHLITLIDVLEHIPLRYHQTVLTRCAHETLPGGYLVIRVPNECQDRQVVEERVYPKVIAQQCRAAGYEVVAYGGATPPYLEIVARKP